MSFGLVFSSIKPKDASVTRTGLHRRFITPASDDDQLVAFQIVFYIFLSRYHQTH